MAQSGYTPILIYASGTATNVPLAANLTSSASGAELALNYADGKLYYKNSSGVVTLLAGSGGGGPAAGSNTQIQFNNSGVFGASVNLTWSGTVLATTGLTATGAILHNTTTNNQSYTTTGAGTITISSGTTGTIDGMNIGATTAGTGRFSSITNTGLTSGRVVYSTTGGLETDSAGLTFDGTNFATTGTATATKLIPTGTSVTGNGMYLPATNALGFSTNGTNAVYIDASQKVGIGTSSPAATLDVVGTIKLNNVLAVRNSSGASFPSGYGWEIYNVDSSNNYLQSYNRTGSAFMNSVYNALSHQFYISGTEQARIDSSGNLLVGTAATSNTNGVLVSKGGAAGGGIVGLYKTASGSTNGLLTYYQSTYVGGINFDNTSTSLATSSDIRLKKDVVDAPSAINVTTSIRVVSHGWKHDEATVRYGFVAQELINVAPEAVMQGDDGEEIETTWTVDYARLVPMLIKSVQEQQALITTLTARIEVLEAK